MKILNLDKLRNTLSLLIGLMLSQAIYSTSLNAQSITVIVQDQSVLKLDRLDVYVSLTESKYNKPQSISSEKFIAELDAMKLENKLFDSRIDSTFYKKNTKQEAVRITKTSTYHIVVSNIEDRDKLTKLIRSKENVELDSTDIKSKDLDLVINKMTDELLSQAKVKANEMAVKINRKATEITNIKVLILGAGGTSYTRIGYSPLEESAHVKLEVTFETEEL